jgi:hypothetical protein
MGLLFPVVLERFAAADRCRYIKEGEAANQNREARNLK